MVIVIPLRFARCTLPAYKNRLVKDSLYKFATRYAAWVLTVFFFWLDCEAQKASKNNKTKMDLSLMVVTFLNVLFNVLILVITVGN